MKQPPHATLVEFFEFYTDRIGFGLPSYLCTAPAADLATPGYTLQVVVTDLEKNEAVQQWLNRYWLYIA